MKKQKHVYLSGGLGNQMFQYAFYLSMKQRGIPCVLDASLFLVSRAHNGFELSDVFDIKDEVFIAPKWVGRGYLLYKKWLSAKKDVFNEQIFNYCEDAYDSSCTFYEGCWLNELYLNGIEELIRSRFVFNHLSDETINKAKELRSENSVSLHIRRGDYLNISYYNVCDERYYTRSIDYIKDHIENPIIFVFSDDPEWSKRFMSRFNIPYQIISINSGKDAYQDMYLMSQCKAHIIANSTFSWWGAWLNNKDEKIVVGPSVWTRDRNLLLKMKGCHYISIK